MQTNAQPWWESETRNGFGVDQAYLELPSGSGGMLHQYGSNVHISANPWLHAQLDRIRCEKTGTPMFCHLVRRLYHMFLPEVAGLLFPRRIQSVRTPMAENHGEKGIRTGQVCDPTTQFVVVDLERAGSIPSLTVFEALTDVVLWDGVRRDVHMAARVEDDKLGVIGTTCSGRKVGGSIEHRILLFTDIMGATGGSIAESIGHYTGKVQGDADMFVVMCFIITPEFIKKILEIRPDTRICAICLDRGLSTELALNSRLGEYPDQEQGLVEKIKFIVPGLGGAGERSTNSWC